MSVILYKFKSSVVLIFCFSRPNLKLILMSATLNANMFSEYFGNCPMIDIPGFTFPVTEFWIEDILGMIQYRPLRSVPKKEPKWWKYARRNRYREDEIRKEQEFLDKFDDYIVAMRQSYPEDVVNSLATMDHDNFDLDLGAELIRYICLKKPQGAILMFLPGWDQISKMNDLLMKQGMFRSSNYRIIPLHSMMPSVNQRQASNGEAVQVFDRPPEGVRKIIIATNIAETSITIDDVVYVIDMGRVKETNFDLKLNLSTLKPEWVSKASAHQRRGRAGRVQPGECYHAYSQLKADLMEDYQLPEMLRTPLESLCLRVKTLKLGLIEPFISKALQPPDSQAITLAVQTLHQLKALDANEDLTALGYHLSLLPVNPRIGKIILFGAMFCCLDPVLTIAASLDFKDPFVIPLGKEEVADRKRKELSEGSFSDHIMLVNAFRQWEDARTNPRMEEEFCWDYFLSKNTLKMLDNMKGQFCDLLYDIGFVNSKSCKHEAANRNADNHALIKAALCAGLYPNIASVQSTRGFNKHTGRPKKPKIYTFQDGKVELHLKSVNAQENNFPSTWLLYHTKIKSTCIFIHDASPIDPYPLLFFGGDISLINDDGHETICIDNNIRFHAPFETANLVKDLRSELDKLLATKIEKPGATDWSSNSIEGRIMKAITDLLSSGETGYGGKRATPADSGRKEHYRYDRCKDW
ncbi:ATP-dependent RNA helicase DHX36 [Holothuria leucospilota]|uniref:ATP-dependent RNA helicase DHX36 n=1 Tax=Holothuria leucospilota TaxID=206669 RepID=A0A9Q1BUD7_HOLLE|nr:ATP-dependent RNA helicase DHX36 [Holothuria leucospilota]